MSSFNNRLNGRKAKMISGGMMPGLDPNMLRTLQTITSQERWLIAGFCIINNSEMRPYLASNHFPVEAIKPAAEFMIGFVNKHATQTLPSGIIVAGTPPKPKEGE